MKIKIIALFVVAFISTGTTGFATLQLPEACR
jgi:hypothetical protein